VRIAIVNDTTLAAETLRRLIAGTAGHSVAWVASNGSEAVERCQRDTPDLILMDLIMPVMDGVEATRRIMATSPCAILVVTATIDGNSAKVFEALGAGALDAVQTPALYPAARASGSSSLVFKVEALERRITAERLRAPERPPVESPPLGAQSAGRLVVIGASAGGPAAIAAILSRLPADLAAGLVIIQHIDQQFVPSMVSWLNAQSRIPVRIAAAGDSVRPGIALIAGTNDHLTFVGASMLGPTPGSTLGYCAEPRESPYRPSVDVLFESVLRHWRSDVVGVLLSGIGRDGAVGLKKLRDSGAVTIAQDAASCAVYGMPKAAIELGGAALVLPVESIADELVRICSKSPRRYPV